jgi:thioredoxin-like negative regulator of GroEL
MNQALYYFFGGIILLFLIAQMVVWVYMRKHRGQELVNLKGSLGDAVKTGTRVIAYFHTPSDPVCRSQTPIIRKLADEFENVLEFDITQDFELARAVGVKITPTVVIIEGGEIRDFLEGARTEEMLREALM